LAPRRHLESFGAIFALGSFKGIAVPTLKALEDRPERAELESEWKSMLAHQLPTLPQFEDFWHEVPAILDWLHGAIPVEAPAHIPIRVEIDTAWRPPAMAQPWHFAVPLEIIRFAASNRLCVDLQYQGTWRLIEAYSLRKTRDGNLLLFALKHKTSEPRSFRVDRIQGAKATSVSFVPKYVIELTPSGAVPAPPLVRQASGLKTSDQEIF